MSWDVDRVLTPIDNDLDILYPRTTKKAKFKIVLTGYAPTKTPITPPLAERPIDLGQRVRMMSPHLGQYAQQKANQSMRVADVARAAGFVVDVSMRTEDGFVGASWLDFLRKCKFTVGMKGGASIADPYGLLYNRVEARRHRYESEHLTAASLGFLRRRDGKHRFSAISPRLFEAAASGTCQILKSDDYLSVLEPWRHYIPLQEDFSNLDEVVRAMSDLEMAADLVKNAYETLIVSGKFSYRHLVSAATDGLLGLTNTRSDAGWHQMKAWLALSARLSTDRTQSLSHAAFHLIHETSAHRSVSAAERIVLERLARESASDWFRLMSDAVVEDRLIWRLPWIPRLLPAV
jgi:hypothetical protein